MTRINSCREAAAALAALLAACAAHAALADERAAGALAGIWAHSEADCQTKLSGALDRGGVPRVEQTPYEFLGFCKNGMELLYQPVYCSTAEIRSLPGGFGWSGKCRVKDYAPRPLKFTIKAVGPNAIEFNAQDFDDSDISIEGSYVRCSLTYKCLNDE